MKISKFFEVTVQIWEEEDGSVYYSVIQDFDEKAEDNEPLAYGTADNIDQAKRLVRDELRNLF